MNRIDSILTNNKYKEYINRISALEVDRIYCRHDMVHFLDVARIATILNYELNLNIDRELIYASALLHDIGRFVQYEDGTPHEKASARLAPDILKEALFDEWEIAIIIEAISEHGNEMSYNRNDLVGIIYRGDKLSRKCFLCNAADTCHKAMNKRNITIKY